MPTKAHLALSRPVQKPRGWGIPSPNRELPRPWYGLDTERDAKTGEFVCGWCADTKGGGFQFQPDFRTLPAGTYWIYNLEYDIEGLLRNLGIEEAWAAREDGAKFRMQDGWGTYFHGKKFVYRGRGKTITFLEAASFFNRVPLSDIGAKEGIKGAYMSLEKYLYDKEPFCTRIADKRPMTYREAVDSYCLQDARIVVHAMEEMAQGMKELGVSLAITPGATARRYIGRLGPFPEILWENHKIWLRSYAAGRFELTKRGIIDNVHKYDIVSAFPDALAKCPWLTDNAEMRTTRRLSDNSLYGSYKIQFDMFDSYLGLAPIWQNGIRVYSKGEDEVWVTRPELDWLQRNGFNYNVLDGVEVFDEGATNAWNVLVRDLFRLKDEGNFCFQELGYKCAIPKCKKCKQRTPLGKGSKVLLNSLYGILVQLMEAAGTWVSREEAIDPIDWAGGLALERPPEEMYAGQSYAPIYAANLTALTRVRILDAAMYLQDAYIGGHTDSVCATRKLPESWLGPQLGKWEYEGFALEGAFCKTGVYAMDNKVHFRGITRSGSPDLLWRHELVRNSRKGIKSASSWDEVSVISPKVVANNWEIDRKREWLQPFDKTVIARREFVDSEAMCYVQS